MRRFLISLLLFIAFPSGLPLDVEISSISCRQDLYVTVDYMELDCNGSSRCTFGSYADVNGNLKFQNDLADSGLYEGGQEQFMYLSGDLNTWTVRYDLMDFHQISLCWEYDNEEADGGEEQDAAEADANDDAENGGRRLNGENVCPANGKYPFSIRYKLPDADHPAVSWMATGWSGTSDFYLYAKSEEEGGDSYPLGQCTITLSTFVTPSATEGLLHTPSAATTAGIVLASAVAAGLLAMYCYCCVKQRKRKFEPTKEGDDITSSFRRMDTTDEGEKVNVDGKVI
ncbi:hypothetical protein ACA910_020139 [Epithemia clementina (nom. ined.)]